MRNVIIAAAAAAAIFATPARAAELVHLVNTPGTNSPYSFTFTATAPNTSVTFAGYDQPSITMVRDMAVSALGGGSNLLGGSWSFTPAPCGSVASSTPTSLSFGGLCTGSYDSFSQSFASAIGQQYTLSFTYSSEGTSQALRVSTDDAPARAVPEPHTWLLMLLGFGAIGAAMRRRRAAPLRLRFA